MTSTVKDIIKKYESLSSSEKSLPVIMVSERRRRCSSASTASTASPSHSSLSSSPGTSMNMESLYELEKKRQEMYNLQRQSEKTNGSSELSRTAPMKSGFLIKRPRSMGRDWNQKSTFRRNKRRWFVLKESILSYYKTYDSDTPIDSIHIDKNTVVMSSTTNPKALDVITLQGKILSMSALEIDEKLQWIEALNNTIQRWR